MVLAPGVSCFVAGMEYAHGGLTLQEALIPSLTVSAKQAGGVKSIAVQELKWSGLRLNLVLTGAQGLMIDVRSKVADGATTFVTSTVTCMGDGQKTSLLIADDSKLGSAAFLVAVDQHGEPIFKYPVVIGES